MPKLPGIIPKKLVKILKEIGFGLDHTSGSHFVFYHPKLKNEPLSLSIIKDLPKGTLISILKEAGIERKQFEDLLK